LQRTVALFFVTFYLPLFKVIKILYFFIQVHIHISPLSSDILHRKIHYLDFCSETSYGVLLSRRKNISLHSIQRSQWDWRAAAEIYPLLNDYPSATRSHFGKPFFAKSHSCTCKSVPKLAVYGRE
jgi:hypothetical protein